MFVCSKCSLEMIAIIRPSSCPVCKNTHIIDFYRRNKIMEQAKKDKLTLASKLSQAKFLAKMIEHPCVDKILDKIVVAVNSGKRSIDLHVVRDGVSQEVAAFLLASGFVAEGFVASKLPSENQTITISWSPTLIGLLPDEQMTQLRKDLGYDS